jgi:Ran GTPase-activating protein (RanGAP) involved in mRNA processing and transport
LNLKCNNITEQSLETFKEELIKLKNLKEFNILDNPINDQGFVHLLNAFISLPELRILNVSNCNISNNGIKKLYDLINSNETFLKKLENINLSGNAINDECINNIIFIIKKLPLIKKFSISQSQISSTGLNQVNNILKNEINNFWYFDMEGGWFILSNKFAQDEIDFDKKNKLNDTPVIFGDIRISYLRRNRKKLMNKTHFDFSNSKVRNKNVLPLLEKELTNFPNIKVINLSFIYNITLPGYEALCAGFKKLPNLTKLILSSNNISDRAFEYIYAIFDKCKKISCIDMSINNITNSGFINFCLSLTRYEIKINEIDFYSNKIGNEGFKSLCEESKSNTFVNLQKLNLSKNLLGNDAIKDFSIYFPKFENLVEVDFSFNNIGDEITLYFTPPILNDLVDIIHTIDISNNKLSDEVKNYFKESGIPFNIIY